MDVLPMTSYQTMEVGCKFVTLMSDDIASEEMSTTSVPCTKRGGRTDRRKEKLLLCQIYCERGDVEREVYGMSECQLRTQLFVKMLRCRFLD
ncbi:hypothetical protein TNIN_203611 [Trichonephila inaurata madagascariensis]|uniref:Uncharacterized protein n=1 Tax=Trichonephila inaurata madagascariensis TaxID=2747483 RepID=A0A8X6WNW1_9ARAC|nr:hypothetical protein TNIN_203611 [Trichonephila inaurata madagascariensis]